MEIRTRKIKDKCEIETIKTEDTIMMRCKNLRRRPNAQEIIDEVKKNKIVFKL